MIRNTIHEITRLFDAFNAEFFGGELPETMICVQSTAKKKAYGYVSVKRVWSEKDGEKQRYELTIGAEYLNRPVADIAGTILHECVHLRNLQRGIKDGSGKSHNKKFKEACDAIGLHCEKADGCGWGDTHLSQEQRSLVTSLAIDESAFQWFREIEAPAPSKPPKPKNCYVCACGQSFEIKEEVDAACTRCGEVFHLQQA